MESKKLRTAEILLTQRLIKEQQVRITWTREQILNEQLRALRQLLKHAKQRSSWHQKRLANIDVDHITLAELSSLATMTKKDVMENWDMLVTRADLTLEKANDFIMKEIKPSYLLDQYHVYATGGSSGTRGVFVWDKEAFANFASIFFRYQFRDDYLQSENTENYIVAVIASEHPVHMSTPLFSVPLLPKVEMHLTPAVWPIAKLVAELNVIKPTHLIGYSSAIHNLAEQAEKGTLLFKPRRVSVNSEPLFPETLKLIKKVWDVPVNNMWASTDGGPLAGNCDYSNDLHLNEDVVIIEVENDKILLTNLLNPILPLIRYEIDDKITLVEEMCPCGSKYRLIKQIVGRIDDDFVYENGITISTEYFESALYSLSQVEEYQIFQTQHGANIFIITSGEINAQALIADLTRSYQQSGFLNPKICVEVVDKLERHPQTGKLRRFVPLK